MKEKQHHVLYNIELILQIKAAWYCVVNSLEADRQADIVTFRAAIAVKNLFLVNLHSLTTLLL